MSSPYLYPSPFDLKPSLQHLGYIINKPIGTLPTQNRKWDMALHTKKQNLLQ